MCDLNFILNANEVLSELYKLSCLYSDNDISNGPTKAQYKPIVHLVHYKSIVNSFPVIM